MDRRALFLASWLLGCAADPADPLAAEEAGTVGAMDALPSEPDAAFDVVQDTRVDCRVAQKDGMVCACTEVGQRPPTLYLLLDRSGSMGELAPSSTRSKWSLVRSALLDSKAGVLRKFGGRLTIAAAWFPSPSAEDACNAGKQLFGPVRGSPSAYDALEAKLASAIPRGSTPTAASLDAVAIALAAVPKPAYVLLATDGAPNCGVGPCGADGCTYNIERDQVTFSGACGAAFNCCDPSKTARGLGWKACVDLDASTRAAAAIAAAGHKVFVLGVPGTIAEYSRALDALAVAGGAPREGAPRFYAANEPTLESLSAALASIAGKVVDTCDIRLEAPVPDPGVTNVLLDGDAVTDWRWTSDSSIELLGAACDRIHAGTVASVQVVVGCRTVTK